MTPAQRAAETSLTSAQLHDDVMRRQTTALLQVAGEGQLLPQVAQARPLAAVSVRFLHQTLARSV